MMKVLLINGSPNAKGCTYTALTEVASTLEAEGIKTELIHVGRLHRLQKMSYHRKMCL